MSDRDDIDTHYQTWTADRSPASLGRVIKALKPTVDFALTSLNAGNDNVLKAEATALAAKAVKSYSPESGAGLRTWVVRNLQGVSRIKRRTQSTLSLPERTQLDGASLEKARAEFADANGRDPDVLELADKTGLSVKRITAIRQAMRISPSESALDGAQAHTGIDFSKEAADYVIEDLPYIDRKIVEWKLGYAGHQVLPAHEIAAKLKLSPSSLSRRSTAIALKLHQVEEDLKSTHGES